VRPAHRKQSLLLPCFGEFLKLTKALDCTQVSYVIAKDWIRDLACRTWSGKVMDTLILMIKCG